MVPVLTPEEASALDPSQSPLPCPHPHLSRTPPTLPKVHALATQVSQVVPGCHNREVLRELGTSAREMKQLVVDGAILDEDVIPNNLLARL